MAIDSLVTSAATFFYSKINCLMTAFTDDPATMACNYPLINVEIPKYSFLLIQPAYPAGHKILLRLFICSDHTFTNQKNIT